MNIKSLSLVAAFTLNAAAADWPQYRGVTYDGSSSERVDTAWPKQGPREIWKVSTPAGFSSFVVANGHAFTLVGREAEGVMREVCVALDANTGKEVWSQEIGVARYGHDGGNAGTSDNKGGDGPRSTPTVKGDRVYAISANLVVVCLDAKTGKKLWSRDVAKEHNGKNITWKNAASPVIDGDLLFLAGGGEGQALIALKTSDGSVAWAVENDAMTHATPTLATIHGTKQVIFFTQKGLVSVIPANGKVLWRYTFPFNVSTAASPVVGGDIVYCSAGYGVGAGAAKISKQGDKFTAKELWRKSGDKPLANHWSTPVYKDGHLYGMFSFKEYGKGPVKCVELATGKEVWAKEGFGPGNVILAGNRLVALSDKGELVLIEATPQSYRELARADVLQGKCWSTPILSNGRIFARSTTEAVCLDVSSKQAKQ